MWNKINLESLLVDNQVILLIMQILNSAFLLIWTNVLRKYYTFYKALLFSL